MADTSAVVPRVVAGCDVTKLPLDAIQGFVFSRVDGATSVAEIAAITGMSSGDVRNALERLADLGAIELPGRVRTASVSPSAPPAKRSPSVPSGPLPGDGIDLPMEMRARIDALAAKLDDLDHYQLLEVSRTAEKKEIKSAYYALAATFHTDRYFGKSLGAFKPKMELLFGRITLAHDTLSYAQRRAEYDEYLRDRDETRALEQALDVAENDLEVAEEKPIRSDTVKRIESSPAIPALKTPLPLTPEQERARREALARRLGGGSSPRMNAVRPSNAGMPVVKAPSSPSQPAVKAAAPVRIASVPPPGPPKSSAEPLSARNLSPEAKQRILEKYLKTARYEESEERWTAASLSYLKAHATSPDDPNITERAAHALHREGRDLHRAAHLAEAAVQKVPTDPAFRVTLARIYQSAGLVLRARKEAERALELAPGHPGATALLAQLR